MSLRYKVPDRLHPSREAPSAFGIDPTFRNFRLFLDVQSFSVGPDAPICWYAEDDRVTAWSNSDGVGSRIEEHLDNGRGPVVTTANSAVSISAWDTMKPWLRQLLPGDQQEEVFGKLPALAFSRMVEADAFVTESRPLLRIGAQPGKRLPTIIDTREAVALLGLYFRLRQDYSVRTGPGGTSSIGRLGYGDLVAQLVLPSVELLGSDGWAVQLRLARALYARDRIHRCYFSPKDRGLGDEAFFYLDALLVSLMASFDLIARHAHGVLGLDGNRRLASWTGKWRDTTLKAKHAGLFALTRSTERTGAAIDVCSRLRNYVHGEPLAPIDFEDVQDDRRTLALRIPEPDRSLIDNAIRLLGGDWEILLNSPEFMLVDVPTLAERLIATSVSAFRELIGVLYPSGVPPGRPSAVQHLPERLQPRFVEACRLALGLDL